LYNDGDIKQLGNLYAALSKWLFSLTFTGYIFLFIFGENILGLFGAEFQNAWQMLVLLGLGQTVAAVTGPVGSLLMMTDGERMEMANVWIAVAVNVVINYVLILRYGAVGVAAGTAIAIGLLNILRSIQVYRVLEIHPFSVGYLKHTVAIGTTVPVMILGSRVPFPNKTVMFLVTGIIALITFGISIRLLGIDESDRYLLNSVS
jgi:O-antigen/teichoic acid export membrane protein